VRRGINKIVPANIRRAGTWRLFVGAIVCAIAGAAVAQAIEVPLSFEKLAEQDSALRGWYPPRGKVEGGDLKAPSAGAYMSAFAVGGQDFYFALERANETDPYFNRLYFDANGNHDLRDDGFLEGKEEPINENLAWVKFPAIDIEYQFQGRTPLPYCVSIGLLKYLKSAEFNQEPRLQIMSAGIWTGSFNLDGTQYRVSFGDSDFDGNYGSQIRRRKDIPDYLVFEGDQIRVSRAGASVALYDSMQLSEHLFVRDNYYRLEVNTAERKAILTPQPTPAPALKIEPDMYQVQLVTQDNRTGLCLFEPTAIVHIPPGTYHVASYLSSRTDEQGDRWVLYGRGDLQTALVTVGEPAAAAAVEMPVGPPYRAIVENRENRFKKGPAHPWRLTLRVEGRGGDKVAGVMRVEGNNTRFKLSEKQPNAPIEPAWKVITEDGEVVASGTFEYG